MATSLPSLIQRVGNFLSVLLHVLLDPWNIGHNHCQGNGDLLIGLQRMTVPYSDLSARILFRLKRGLVYPAWYFFRFLSAFQGTLQQRLFE